MTTKLGLNEPLNIVAQTDDEMRCVPKVLIVNNKEINPKWFGQCIVGSREDKEGKLHCMNIFIPYPEIVVKKLLQTRRSPFQFEPEHIRVIQLVLAHTFNTTGECANCTNINPKTDDFHVRCGTVIVNGEVKW